MRIVSASFRGFRNLQENTLRFSPQVNIILGRNGEGKTNLLECLNFMALGRSHRSSRSEDLIHFDGESLHVRLEVEDESGETFECEFGLDRHGERRIRLDGQTIRRRADLVGRLATVFFNPDSIALVRGGPQHRRHFTDQGLAEIDPTYLSDLMAFQRALKQKSGLIKDLKKGLRDWSETRRELKAWNRELARYAVTVCLGRREYSGLLEPLANHEHNTLLDNNLNLDLIYRPRLACVEKITAADFEGTVSKKQLAEEIFEEIDYIGEAEIKRGRPLIGPQFDDFEVRLDGVDLRVFGSQGETRTAAIALILARSDVLFQKRQVRPILFFDDIFSELDRERSRRLQEMASRLHQVFIATARQDDVQGWQPEQLLVWSVEAGAVIRNE